MTGPQDSPSREHIPAPATPSNFERAEDDMRTVAEKLTAIEERAIVERRASALVVMRLHLEELSRRETLCRAEVVHHVALLLRELEEAR